jgi:hypothetical protein
MSDSEYVTGDGGNRNLVNQDEALILARCTGMPVQTVGWQADDSTITSQFREADI